MESGKLIEQIQILRLQQTTNEFNEQFDMYCPCCVTRADVQPVSGGRNDINNEVFYEHTYRFTVRRYVDVDDFDRILWNNKQYRILNIDDDKRLNQKIINAELVNL